MTEIPEDVMATARKLCDDHGIDCVVSRDPFYGDTWAAVASVIMAERERCARIAELFPIRGRSEDEVNFAVSEAKQIAAAIRGNRNG